MAEQQEAEGVYTEHQFMCSECHQLFATLEDVLIHQQIHTGQEGEVEAVTVQGVPELEQAQHYQCLECGSLLVNSEELLQHQEMHMRDAGMEVEQQGKRRDRLFSSHVTHASVLDFGSNGKVRVPQSCVRFWRRRRPGRKLRSWSPPSISASIVWLCLTRLKPGLNIGVATAGAAPTAPQRPW